MIAHASTLQGAITPFAC